MNQLPSGWTNGQLGISYFRYSAYSLLLEWPASMSRDILQTINAYISTIHAVKLTGVNEIVPGYHSIMIYFDTTLTSHELLIKSLENLIIDDDTVQKKSETTIINVSYGSTHGPDLLYVAQSLGLSTAEVIDLHTSVTYDIHFIGFLPGFLYLGGLAKKLTLPRRETPRTIVPAGSVAIAAGQTGIYPSDSPGGWHIIGKTDHEFFNPLQDPPCSFSTGMQIQFNPI